VPEEEVAEVATDGEIVQGHHLEVAEVATDGEIVQDRHLEVGVVADHADQVTGSARSVSSQTLPPEKDALNVPQAKTHHFDKQKVPSPVMRNNLIGKASLTGQHFMGRRMITLCQLWQHLATIGHVRADDH